MSQSKDLWDYPSVRKWSWTLILKSIGEQTPNEIIKCNSCLDPSCMNKAQNNMKQVTHQYDQLLILFKQAFELIEKMLSNISENEHKKLANADWKKFFWVFNPDEDWSNLKRVLLNQANKQYSSLKIRNKTADIIAEDITTYLDHISWKNTELLCDNHSEWELLSSDYQLKITEIGIQISNSQHEIDLTDINTVSWLSQNRVNSIHETISKTVQTLKNTKGIGKLLKSCIVDWIQR